MTDADRRRRLRLLGAKSSSATRRRHQRQLHGGWDVIDDSGARDGPADERHEFVDGVRRLRDSVATDDGAADTSSVDERRLRPGDARVAFGLLTVSPGSVAVRPFYTGVLGA